MCSVAWVASEPSDIPSTLFCFILELNLLKYTFYFFILVNPKCSAAGLFKTNLIFTLETECFSLGIIFAFYPCCNP